MAYASLYKSYGKTLDAVKADDVTVSLVRKAKPHGLFGYFKEHGYLLKDVYRGIYYVEGNVLFPTQIIVTKELDFPEHVWLGALSDQLNKQDLHDLLAEAGKLHGKAEKEYAESVLEVGLGANKWAVKELIGDGNMSEELLEILKPVIEPVWVESIKVAVDALREFGHKNEEIKTVIIEKYGLTEKEADSFLNK